LWHPASASRRAAALRSPCAEVRSGQLRGIALTSAERFGLMPDLPTVAATVPGYVATIWYGLVGPAGMASDVVGTIHVEVVRQLTAADVIAKLEADGSEAIGNSPEKFTALIRTESAQWSEIIRKSAIHLEK
jgi:tripartite-type tricarboxylate transporter receptor subunit TctC